MELPISPEVAAFVAGGSAFSAILVHLAVRARHPRNITGAVQPNKGGRSGSGNSSTPSKASGIVKRAECRDYLPWGAAIDVSVHTPPHNWRLIIDKVPTITIDEFFDAYAQALSVSGGRSTEASIFVEFVALTGGSEWVYEMFSWGDSVVEIGVAVHDVRESEMNSLRVERFLPAEYRSDHVHPYLDWVRLRVVLNRLAPGRAWRVEWAGAVDKPVLRKFIAKDAELVLYGEGERVWALELSTPRSGIRGE